MDDKKSSSKAKPEYAGNSIMVRPNGPLICKGDAEITLQTEDALIVKECEFALCRCGFSENKPFCDGSHKKNKEEATQHFTDLREEDISGLSGGLTITVKKNAMYMFKGPVTIFSRDGVSKTMRTKGALCRCGFSENKPFCDTKHKECGFMDGME